MAKLSSAKEPFQLFRRIDIFGFQLWFKRDLILSIQLMDGGL